jgi:hypothetical protein
LRLAQKKLRFVRNRVFEFPLSLSFFILFIILLYRSSKSDFNLVLVNVVGEDSVYKTIALATAIFSVIFWEIFYRNNLIPFSLKIGIPGKSLFVMLDNSIVRCCAITISVNYLFLLNVLEYKELATKILSLFGILALYPTFADLRTTLLGISCSEVNRIGDYISCGNRGNNWTYPSILLNLRELDINQNAVNLIMFTTLISITLILFILTRHMDFGHFILLIFLLNLPPFLIVTERGNLDLFILVSILGVILLLNNYSTNKWTFILCAFLISMAALLKFYPLIGIAPLVYLSLRNIKQFGRSTLIIVMALGLLAFLILLPDLSRLGQNEVIDLSGSIGLGNLVALASGLDSTKTVGVVSSLLILVLIISIFQKRLWAETAFYSDLNIKMRTELLLTSLIATTPWVTTTNYYYRLILLWPLIYSLLKISGQTSLDLTAITRTILFPTLLSYILVFRTFAIVQNIALIPIYLLAVFFVARELVKIKAQLRLRWN